MNSCILMAEIVQEPQLRYTPGDPQIPVAEMLVQFPAQRADDPPHTLKVVGWRNLAEEIHQRCRQGTQVVIEGRLTMNTIDRPEGFKEKRAELTAQKIHYLSGNNNFNMGTSVAMPAAAKVASPPPRNTSNPVASQTYNSGVATTNKPPVTATANVATMPAIDDEEPMDNFTQTQFTNQPISGNQPDVDDIPF